MDPLIILFGLGVGILIGMTGMGGGSLMTPLLIIIFCTKPVVAVGTDLAYGAITKTLGGWRHLRKGTVDLGLTKWMALGSWPGAVLGVLIIEYIQNHTATTSRPSCSRRWASPCSSWARRCWRARSS